MTRGTALRLSAVAFLLAIGFVFVLRSHMEPAKATLLVTYVIGAVTAIYALFTYEILLQNRAMAQAATDSTKVMERSLRFSYAPNLIFRTLNTKDPTFQARKGLAPLHNDDYERALRELTGSGQQMEFVFAVIQNLGRGPATNLRIEAQYSVSDTGNPNKNYSVTKNVTVQILEPEKAVAVCIYMSKVPTTDDRVELVYANLKASDFYRDALSEPALEIVVEPKNHHIESEAACITRIT